MLPGRATCQQQDRNVSASDEKQQRNRTKKQEERLAQVLHELLVEPSYVYPKLLGEMVRGLLGELFQQGLQLAVCRLESDSRLQLEQRAVSNAGGVGDLQRNVHIVVIPSETRRQHPDHRAV